MNELIFLVEEAPEGGYTARALGESIFTEAPSLAELFERVEDAVGCHFGTGFRLKNIQYRFQGKPTDKHFVGDLLSNGNKIGAIKVLREGTGLGLKEALEAINTMP